MELILQREKQINNATVGYLHGLGQHIFTLEDAWKNNQRNVSCIPAGTYTCVPHGWEENTPFKFKRTWRLENVKDRSAILIHAGNTHHQTQGCILVGAGVMLTNNRSTLLESRSALDLMREKIGENSFTLTIKDWPHG